MKRFLLLLSFTVLTLIPLSFAQSESGNLRVGAARVDITPPVNPNYPPPGKYAHERLYTRAIVLDNGLTRAAIIGIDRIGMSEEIWDAAAPQIAAELACPIENVIVSATHSHSALPAGPPPPWRPGVRQRHDPTPVVDPVLEAVRQAKTSLQPARMDFGTGNAYLNVNRDAVTEDTHVWTRAANLDGTSDKTVAVLTFTTPGGTPIATYVNYAMHPINAYQVEITTADFPGAACRWVERAFSDQMVMVYSSGALGDQNPLWLRPSTNALASKSGVEITGYEMVREPVEAPLRDGKVPHGKLDPKVVDDLMRWIDALGLVLGEEVIRVMTHTRRTTDEVRIWGAAKTLTCPGRERTDSGREGAPGTYQEGHPVDLRLGLLAIGDTALTHGQQRCLRGAGASPQEAVTDVQHPHGHACQRPG